MFDESKHIFYEQGKFYVTFEHVFSIKTDELSFVKQDQEKLDLEDALRASAIKRPLPAPPESIDLLFFTNTKTNGFEFCFPDTWHLDAGFGIC